ncbi:hypothetical protein GCM10008995_01950 [Halobellus salinus]|uniref:Uncharacterized protein n=1 Tax=Halobellus salinus TaxID=931585 RepID=A0A830EIS7_9EURY|nr:hypothetical protein [Halobellus salinus]GGI95467.1 hypothetical protein GCM10008995_01950 [Halobellus salinus]SMP12267.1 hypothetical protein SAMN06265347_10441 [Halobellus salinus]
MTFETFDPASNTLTLGEPVTFDQYRVPVESLDAFRIEEVLGYRAGAAHVRQTEVGCDFGWVRIAGDAYRVSATRDGREARLVRDGNPVDAGNSYPLTDESSWLARRIAAGDVERVGPIPPISTDERRSPANLPPRRE